MTSFILAYPGTLRTHPSREEAEAAAKHLVPYTKVDGIYIYEIEQAGYISRIDLLIE